jgi:ABC-2 type transport system permease protein
MNIFLRELRANTKSFLVWSGTMIFLIFGGMMKYSAFAKTGQSINEMFNQLPAGLMKVLGIEPGQDLTSVGVFYSIFFLYFLLLMSVHSTMLGASIIAKEERDKTADFLLVKPIRRHQAVTAKILAALVMVVLFNLVTFTVSAIAVQPYNQTGISLTGPIFTLCSTLLVVQILFLGVGLCLGAWAHNAEKASGLATTFILSTFILKVLIDLKDDISFLEFLTPFRYFKSYSVMFEHDIPIGYIALSLIIAAAGIAGTYYFFQKRDLHS